MAGLGLNKKFGLISTITMVIANIAPDLDVITFLKGPKTFYKYHREVTHSILGVVILWILISTGIYLFTPFHNLPAIIAMVGGGLLGHLLLDSLTPWGLPLFYPLNSKKYGFDLIWFCDPVIIGSMVGGVYLGFQYPHLEQVIYILSFALISSYLVLRVTQKRRALKLAKEELTPRFKDAEVHILPSAVSPFMWDVIFSARSQYLYISVDSRREEITAVKEFTSSGYHRCVKCSCESDLVEVFLKRARFPFYNVVRNEGSYTIEWSDAQLSNLGGVHGVTVTVDENGQIKHQKLQVKRPVRRRKRRRLADYLQREAS